MSWSRAWRQRGVMAAASHFCATPDNRKEAKKSTLKEDLVQVTVPYGLTSATFDVAEQALVQTCAAEAPVVDDVAAAVRHALDHPFELPALRRCVTPDDHVAVLIDERLPHLSALLIPLLEYLVEGGIDPSAITLLCAPPSTGQPWLDDLPESLEEIVCEVHDPSNDKKMSYLATTQKGRRLYFNRSMVDADQLIVLSGRRYDPFFGYGGGAGCIYPTFSDEKTRQATARRPTLEAPNSAPWPLFQEATEAAWLLGAPFFVQIIEGPGDSVAQIVCGLLNSIEPAQALLDEQWRRVTPRCVDLAVVGLSGDSVRHQLSDLADALASASRVLKPKGRIALLTEAKLDRSDALQLLFRCEEPEGVLNSIDDACTVELRAAWQWAAVAEQARIYLLSQSPPELAEEIFAVPLDDVKQVQRLIDASASCLFVSDANKSLLVAESAELPFKSPSALGG